MTFFPSLFPSPTVTGRPKAGPKGHQNNRGRGNEKEIKNVIGRRPSRTIVKASGPHQCHFILYFLLDFYDLGFHTPLGGFSRTMEPQARSRLRGNKIKY